MANAFQDTQLKQQPDFVLELSFLNTELHV